MIIDSAYGNSSGYFRDPTNGEDLTVDTPRIIQCELKDGKFVWPQVAAADGSRLLKIVYKLFTDEEKELYKQYRGRSSSGEPRPKREPREHKEPKESKEPKINVEEQAVSDEPIEVVKYNEQSAMSANTAEVIASCDQFLGCSQITGLTYVLLGRRGSNKVYHIPRAIIPDNEFARLCGGV